MKIFEPVKNDIKKKVDELKKTLDKMLVAAKKNKKQIWLVIEVRQKE